MPKISALPNQTTPDGADELPVNDVSATTTKKMTLTVFKEWLQSLTSWITTAMITDRSVTAVKTFLPHASAISSGTQTVSNTTGTTTDVTLATVDVNQSGFSLSSNGLTIQDTGDYMLVGEVRCTDVQNFFSTITRNGSAVIQLAFAGRTSTSRGYQGSNGFGIISLTAGDVIKLRYENRDFASSITFARLGLMRIY